MAYLTETDLRGYSSAGLNSTWRQNIRKSAFEAKVSIFLSHSHKDRVMAQGMINYLASLGIALYVDWNDSEMPRITDRTTAENIKARIQENALFMILATPNALESKWVPWETGIADQSKGEHGIILVPVADPTGRFHGSEYMQIYDRVEIAESGSYAVFGPAQHRGVLLENRIRKFSS